MITSAPGTPHPTFWWDYVFENVKYSSQLCLDQTGVVEGELWAKGVLRPDHPISGARLILYVDGNRVGETQTDSNGHFALYYQGSEVGAGKHSGRVYYPEHNVSYDFQFVVLNKECGGGVSPPGGEKEKDWLKYIALIGVMAAVMVYVSKTGVEGK